MAFASIRDGCLCMVDQWLWFLAGVLESGGMSSLLIWFLTLAGRRLIRCSQPQRQFEPGVVSATRRVTARSGVHLDATLDRSPEVILSFPRSPVASSSSPDNQPDRGNLTFSPLLPPGSASLEIPAPPLPSPSFPAESHTSRSGDPPLSPSQSTLTYIPNSPWQQMLMVLREGPPGQRAGRPGSPGCRQAPQAAGGVHPLQEPPTREGWKWKVRRLWAGGRWRRRGRVAC